MDNTIGEANWTRLGRLETWVVGLNHLDRRVTTQDQQEAFFKREPSNPVDANAILVLDAEDSRLGYLPSYDAAHLSPLICEGLICLRGRLGQGHDTSRLPITLEILAAPGIARILNRDPSDDWRSLYHNLLADLWGNFSHYQASTLKAFRERFRPLAHQQSLWPKTQLLYRLLKARVADLEFEECEKYRKDACAKIDALHFGNPIGTPDWFWIPLMENGKPTVAHDPTFNNPKCLSDPIPIAPGGSDDFIVLPGIPLPYPPGTHGWIEVREGQWDSIEWFACTKDADTYWPVTIIENEDNPFPMGPIAPQAVQRAVETLLQKLRQADFQHIQRCHDPEEPPFVSIRTRDCWGRLDYEEASLKRLYFGIMRLENRHRAPL